MADPGAAPGAGRSPEALDLEPFKRRIAKLAEEGAAHIASWMPDGHIDRPDVECYACDDIFGEANALTELVTEIERLRGDAAGVSAAPSGWQPIETAPTDQRVLALLKVRPLAAEGEIAFVYWAGAVWTYDETGVACEPEWWLPVPPTPASASPSSREKE